MAERRKRAHAPQNSSVSGAGLTEEQKKQRKEEKKLRRNNKDARQMAKRKKRESLGSSALLDIIDSNVGVSSLTITEKSGDHTKLETRSQKISEKQRAGVPEGEQQ